MLSPCVCASGLAPVVRLHTWLTRWAPLPLREPARHPRCSSRGPSPDPRQLRTPRRARLGLQGLPLKVLQPEMTTGGSPNLRGLGLPSTKRCCSLAGDDRDSDVPVPGGQLP